MTQQFLCLLLLDSVVCMTIEATMLHILTLINIFKVVKLKLILNFEAKCSHLFAFVLV